MGKKKRKRGHYCKVCGRIRANEKFSGKGHRQHICKDCKRKGKKLEKLPSTGEHDRILHYYSKSIKNCLIFYTGQSNFFLFEYKNERYITRDDFESEIFLYQPNQNQKFFVAEYLQLTDELLEVLNNKYYYTLGSEHILPNELLEEEISKSREQYLEVIFAMNNLV